MTPKISIIIVTYNSGPLALLCLWALQKAGLQHSEIIVIDNAGNDQIPDQLKQQFPFIRLIKSKTNDGFGRACNRGMKEAQGEYFLLLNPDTIVPENFEQSILRFFEEHPQAGAMGVKMISGRGTFLRESKRNLPTPLASLYRFAGMAHLFPNSGYFAGYYAGDLPISEEGQVEVLSGAFMVVTRKAINVTGAFDPRFFLYGEDIDLSYRIHQAGFQTWYNPNLQIIHFKGESTAKDSRQARIFYTAMRQFYQKHFTKRYPAMVSYTVLAVIESLSLLAAIKHRLTSHLPKKNPSRFCLTKDSLDEAVDHLNKYLPFQFLKPEACKATKTPGATLLDTTLCGPNQIIQKAQQCQNHNLQLFIYHPPTRHLFQIANQHKRSQIFKT